jgi:hypothetical protein
MYVYATQPQPTFIYTYILTVLEYLSHAATFHHSQELIWNSTFSENVALHVMTPRSMTDGYKYCRGGCCLHLHNSSNQSQNVGSLHMNSGQMKMGTWQVLQDGTKKDKSEKDNSQHRPTTDNFWRRHYSQPTLNSPCKRFSKAKSLVGPLSWQQYYDPH